MDQLLAGLVVVEASRGVAARYCGRLFAQFGATVVRAPGGDDRDIGYGGQAGEAYGRWLDAGKAAGPPPVASDLVITGPDTAAAPDAPTRLDIRWFHPAGPWAEWQGSDELIQSVAGMAYGFGEPQGPPTLAQGHAPQIAAGVTAFNAALAALMANPRPRRVEVNVFEAYMCLTEPGAVAAFVEGGQAVRLGVNRIPPIFVLNSYRSADGWVGVTTVTPAQWQGLCRILDRPDLAADVRYTTALERLAFADEIDPQVAPLFTARTTDEWVRLGHEARVPITAMPNLQELPQTPHWRERGAFGPFDGSGALGPTVPWRFQAAGPKRPFAADGAAAPLKGLRVVDFTMGWAGPLCTRTLADLGADVVKIESGVHPDWWRGWEADQSGDPPPLEMKFSFISMNRNKRGIILELDTPEGLARAKALVAGADVVVENYAAGVMEKLGLGPAALRALNPGLIAISMPAFGAGGPLSATRAYGSTVEQASGLPFANGRGDWPPCVQHVAYGDPLVGLFGAAVALAAIAGRGRCGGAEVDLAQVACLFQFGADAIIAQHLSETPLARTGNRRPRAAPVCVVPADGDDSWLTVVVDGEGAWRGLCDALGRPEWAEDPALATLAGRAARADEIEGAIAAWSAGQDALAAAEALQAAGVPAAPVKRIDELGYDMQLSDGGFWPEITRCYVGTHIIPAAPFAYDGRRPALRNPAPTLGEHTDEVLAGLDALTP